MTNRTAPFLTLTIAALAVQPAAAATPRSHVEVGDAWSRPVAAGLSTGVAYMTLTETGGAPDRLLGASSPVAASVSLHRSEMTGAMMSMTPVEGGLTLPPGQAVRLAPGGYHFMLEALKAGLPAGRSYPLTLRFAHAPPRTVRIVVRRAAPGA